MCIKCYKEGLCIMLYTVMVYSYGFVVKKINYKLDFHPIILKIK